jgi:hypothetical protein
LPSRGLGCIRPNIPQFFFRIANQCQGGARGSKTTKIQTAVAQVLEHGVRSTKRHDHGFVFIPFRRISGRGSGAHANDFLSGQSSSYILENGRVHPSLILHSNGSMIVTWPAKYFTEYHIEYCLNETSISSHF